jgi:hypothetical protein
MTSGDLSHVCEKASLAAVSNRANTSNGRIEGLFVGVRGKYPAKAALDRESEVESMP